MEYTLTSDNFQQEVIESGQPVLVDLFATWCGPCKMMSPIISELAEEYEGKVKVGKLDVDQANDIASKFGIMSIPTFLFFKDGEVVHKIVGACPKEDMVTALNKL